MSTALSSAKVSPWSTLRLQLGGVTFVARNIGASEAWRCIQWLLTSAVVSRIRKVASVALQSYLKILAKHWKLISVVALLVVVATVLATYLMPKTYESRAQFFVSTVDTTDNSQLAQGSTFLQQRVKSYSQLLAAPVVLSPVIQQLGLRMSVDDLAANVKVTVPPETVLIEVSVADRDPAHAQRIAAALADQFPRVVSNLERVSKNRESPVKVTVTRPPTLDLDPVSPRPVRNIALGLILGLLLGVGAAMLRHVLDTRVRTREDISALDNDISTLGEIPFDRAAFRQPLLTETDPHTPRAEAFRSLRTNLAFVDAVDAPRSIVMTSALPGEGKTTTTANFALVLAESEARVCLVEADLRRPQLLEYFGMTGAVGLTDVLIGRAELTGVLQPYGSQGLNLLGAGRIPPNPSELLGSPTMQKVLAELGDRFEYVLIDAPPLLPVTDAAVLSVMADGVLIVAGSGLVTRDQLTAAVNSLRAVNGRLLGVALNRVKRGRGTGRYADYSYRARRTRRETISSGGWELPDTTGGSGRAVPERGGSQ